MRERRHCGKHCQGAETDHRPSMLLLTMFN